MSPAPAPPPPARPGPAILLVLVMMLGAVAAYSALVWPEWRRNADLSHGLFAPLIFLLLIYESRQLGSHRWLPANNWRLAAAACALLGAVLLLGIAGLLAASVGWTHSLVMFALAAVLCVYLFTGLLVLAGEGARTVPFNWISLTAILLWLLVAPLPHGTYARLTLALQGWVTDGVLHALHLLGVPARQRGNVIELALTTVGVEEACSGIRSLLSCIYAGFFFAAWQVRRARRRAFLIILAPLLAIGMNFIRSLSLTLMANAGIDIAGFWHDVTGFAILGLTAAILAGLALWLSPKAVPAAAAAPADSPPGRPAYPVHLVFWSSNAALVLLAVFFIYHSRPATRSDRPLPELAQLLPAKAGGWEVITTRDLYMFADVLHTPHLYERTYLKGAGAATVQLTVYVAYWPAGQASVSLVAAHTPDACWPGAGWNPAPTIDRQVVLTLPGRRLSEAEHRLFANAANFRQHVWFWHVYDGRVISYRDPYSVPALLQIALQYGFRREGDQFFVRFSSNQPWDQLAAEPLLRELADNFSRIGL